MDERDSGEGPLKSEQLKRDKWRGGDTFLNEEEGAGHTLPESERDKAALKSGDEDQVAHPRTIAPPD